MSRITASAMRRIYYATIIVGLLSGGVFFASTLRYGSAEWGNTEDLFFSDDAIAIPSDFPTDVPVYQDAKISIVLSGFDFSGGLKAHRLMYRVEPPATFSQVTDYYRRELKIRGWTTEESMAEQAPSGAAPQEFGGFFSSKADIDLNMGFSVQENSVVVRITYWQKNSVAAPPDAKGAEIPADFPFFLPVHAEARLFSYEVNAPQRGQEGINRYTAYFQVPGAKATLAQLKAFYVESMTEQGWEIMKESSMNHGYLAFADGARKLGIVIRPMSMHVFTEGDTPESYQVNMDTGANIIPGPTEEVQHNAQTETQRTPVVGQPANEATPHPLVVTNNGQGAPHGFTDLPNGYGYNRAIGKLKEKGVFKGYADGSFRPGNPVNRAEFLKTVLEAAGSSTSEGSCFPDVRGDQWFARYVCQARQDGIVQGYGDGKFHPEWDVSRAEAVKIVTTAFRLTGWGMTEGWTWYDKYFNTAEAKGGLSGLEGFRDEPEKPLIRGEMAQLIANISFGDSLTASSSEVIKKEAGAPVPKALDLKTFFVEHTPDPSGCPTSGIMGAKSFVRVVSPNGGEELEYATMLKAEFSSSPDIRNLRFGLVMPSGERPVLAYINIACHATAEWMLTKNGPMLMKKELPIKAKLYVEGAKAYPDFTVSDESDNEFTIVSGT